MYRVITGFEPITKFAKRYVGPRVRKESSTKSLYNLVMQELKREGSTCIDVIIMGGQPWVKYKTEITNVDLKAIENPPMPLKYLRPIAA